MKLDIELSETEIHVIRLALEHYDAMLGDDHVELVDRLRARFKDLAMVPTP